MSDYIIDLRKTLSGRVVGLAKCGTCDWQAQHTADTQAEVDQFLSVTLVAHVLDAHRELVDGSADNQPATVRRNV